MKLIEKLAEEYRRKSKPYCLCTMRERCFACDTNTQKWVQEAYLEGFRAARKLLVEKAKEGWTECRFDPDQNKYVPGPKHIGTVCQSDIEQLGEEEV